MPDVQVVAHRGASAEAPEHTLAAYERAIKDGADAVECDVRMTRDGHLVCLHDRRVDRTSDGRGPVSARGLAELEALDVGAWAGVPGHRVLTLDALLGLVLAARRRVEVHLEVKHPVRHGRLVEQQLAQTLDRAGLLSSDLVTVMSFAPVSLRRIRVLAPALSTVLLLDLLPRRLVEGDLPSYADAAGPSLRLLTRAPALVERVHADGRRVHVWTVDEPEDVERVVGLGVDAVITNRPGQVLAQLGRTQR